MKFNTPEILIPLSILLVTSGVILGINLNNQNSVTSNVAASTQNTPSPEPTVTVNPNFPISPYPTNVAVSFRDPVQVADAPIQPPLKQNPYGPPPPQIATRGHPGNFQQIGILTGSKPGETGEPLILPLYGRHLHNRSDRWEYYVASGGFNQMRMPLKKGGRECMDSPGCEEIQSGDTLNLDGQSTDFKVTVYQNDQPRYYPDVL